MTSKILHQPYFYIIRHIPSNKMYAGSRWGKGCNPLEFMRQNGYTTSSKVVNKIIQEEGLNSFEILRIDTYCDGLHVYNYEQTFLETNNCASSNMWFNKHNGMGLSDWLYVNNIKNPMELPEFVLKSNQTKIKKYGNKNYNNSEKATLSRVATLIEKYGVDNIMKVPNIASKMVANRSISNVEKYGVENTSLLPHVKKKISETTIANNQQKYGVNGYFETEEFSIKSKKTLHKNYGVTHNSQIPSVKESKKQHMLNTYGVENSGQIPFLTLIETKRTYSKASISRHFPYFKQFY